MLATVIWLRRFCGAGSSPTPKMSPSSLSASLSLEDDNHAVESYVVGRDDDLPEVDLLVVRPAVPTVTAVEGKGRVKDVQPAAG
jgi:hypothetical protein